MNPRWNNKPAPLEPEATCGPEVKCQLNVGEDDFILVERKVRLPAPLRKTHLQEEIESDSPDVPDTSKELLRLDFQRRKKHPHDIRDKVERKKRDYVKRLKKQFYELRPHNSSSPDFLTFMGRISSHIKNYADIPGNVQTLSFLENLLILIYGLCKANTACDFIMAGISYIKLHVDSVTDTISDIVDYFITSGDEDLEESLLPHTSSFSMRDLQDSWEMMKGNAIFSKMSYLITAAMASSVCSIKEIGFQVAGIKLIHLEAMQVQASAVDLIDAAISTFTWITETGWCCLKEKSLIPILYSDQRINKYTTDCNEVISLADSVKAGNIEDMSDFEHKLDICLRTTSELQKVTPSLAVKELLQRKYSTLVSIKQDIIAKRKNTQYRFAPIGWSICGESSVGKSNVAEMTMKVSLSAMDFSDAKDRIITLSESDKYDSTYTSDVLGVFIDDANNACAQFVETPPTQKYITMFNNVAAQAIKAEINEKGCVFIDFKVGVITTNTKDLGAYVYSNYPVAVLRRFLHVSITVRPEYRTPGGTSLNVNHPDLLNSKPGELVDVWLFDIEEMVPNGSGGGGTFRCIDYTSYDGSIRRCRQLSLSQYLDAVIYFSKIHKVRQDNQVLGNLELEKSKCCKVCKQLPQYCHCNNTSSAGCHSPHGDTSSISSDEDDPLLTLDDLLLPHHIVEKKRNITLNSKHTTMFGKPITNCIGFLDLKPLDPHVLFYKKRKNAWWEIVKVLTPHLFSGINSYILEGIEYFFSDWIHLGVLRDNVSEAIEQYILLDNFENVLSIMPRWMAQTRWFRKIAFQYRLDRSCFRAIRARNWMLTFSIVDLWILYYYPSGINAALFTTALSAFIYCDLHIMAERQHVKSIIETHSGTLLIQYGNTLRRNWKLISSVSIISLATIAIALDSWNYFRKNPHSLDDFTQIDKKPGWFGFTFGSVKSNCASQVIGATTNHFLLKLRKNLYWCRFTMPDGTINKCNVFFPRKSLMLVPLHIFHTFGNMSEKRHELLCCEIQRNNSPGGKFECKVRLSESYIIPGKDMVACYIPTCPDIASSYKFLVQDKPVGSNRATMLSMREDLSFEEHNFAITYGNVKHKYCSMYGGTYVSPASRTGACMAIVISESKTPAIVGFHIGGNEISQIGICQSLTIPEYETIVDYFDRSRTVLSAEAGLIPNSQYGIALLESTEVHSKAKHILDMTSENQVHVLGSSRLRSKQTSLVESSLLSESVEAICGVPNKWGPPKFEPNWKPFNTNLDLFSKPGLTFDPGLLRRAQLDWEKDVLEFLPNYLEWDRSSSNTFRPLNLKETIMGIDGVRFIDAMPMTTGMGFPIYGKKNKKGPDGLGLHFEEKFDGTNLIDRVPKQHVLDEVNRMLECYARNERAYPVTSATLKDEATKLDKEKVRVFQAAPVALGILVRKYFLPISRFLCCCPLIAELAVGINCFGKEWEEIIDHSFKYASNKQGLAWDYSSYDVRMSSQVTRAVWSTLIHIAEQGGYDDTSIRIMKTMVADICHPLIDINGTLLMALSMNTSGNNMTVFVNSIAGSFYVRMGFFSMYPHAPPFRECVSLMTYGDDGIGSVLPEYDKFHFESYRDFLAEHSMGLTPPSKTGDSYKLMPIVEIDFLKRKSNYIEEIGCSIGKLDESSIFKSLHCNVASSVASKRDVACSCIEGAMHEWFAFGREHYEMRREQMKKVSLYHDLPVPALNYSFDHRVNLWQEKYNAESCTENKPQEESSLDTELLDVHALMQIVPHVYAEDTVREVSYQTTPVNRNHTPLVGRSNPSAHKRESGLDSHVPAVGGETSFSHVSENHTSDTCILCDVLLAMRAEQKDIDEYRERYLEPFIKARLAHVGDPNTFPHTQPGLDSSCFLNMPQEYREKFLNALELGLTWEEYLEEEQKVEEKKKRYRAQFEDAEGDDFDPMNLIVPHSLSEPNPISSGMQATPDLQTANVKFMDAHPGYLDERGGDIDVLRTSMEDSSVSLNDFFARPIKIATYTWDINNSIFQAFNPWQLFFENPRVINRITNYKNLKAELHVKITINGTSMHYGRVLVSYQPLHPFDSRTVFRLGNDLDFVEASQRPSIWLNPAISQGGTLILPFFTPFNMLDIPTGMWRDMGMVTIASVTNLKHANGATNGTTISVFAWAENVVLSGLTAVDSMYITPQSASEYKGIVSKPVSHFAKVARSLAEIPSISKFATATSVGANSIAYMANLFGFSKVRDTELGYHHIQGIDSLAACDGRDNCMVLTVDSKNELTIDPIVAGLESKDELVIRNIASRESFVCKGTWFTSMLPEQKLFNIIVDPGIVMNSGGIADEFHFPACAFASLPFTYWRGSMKYRFQFCCSSFHKGRVKFVYDPYASGTTAEYNTAYTQIIDLSEQNDVTIEVGWGQHVSWRNRMHYVNNGVYGIAIAGVPAANMPYTANNDFNVGNGVLSMYIVSSLASASNVVNNDINFIVSVSAGDDFELACPQDTSIRELGYEKWPNASQLSVNPAAQDLDAPGPLPAAMLQPIPEAGLTLSEIKEAQKASLDLVPQSAPEIGQSLDSPVESGSHHYLGPSPVMSNHLNKIYMGESVISFRSLLKRYNYHEAFTMGNATGNIVTAWIRASFPTWPEVGTYSNMHLVLNTTTAYWGKNTLMHFLTSAFGGWRGGIRQMIHVQKSVGSGSAYLHLTKIPDGYPEVNAPVETNTTPTTTQFLLQKHWPSGVGGCVAWDTSVNPFQKFEIPYQQPYRFAPGKYGNSWDAFPQFQNTYNLDYCGSTVPTDFITRWVAAGEDFTLLFYLGPPIMYGRPTTLLP